MKRNHAVTAFYLETLLLIVVFLGIILVLTQVFGLARIQSASARQLTEAVTLAENAAEAVSCSASPEALLELLNEQNNAVLLPDGNGVTARYREGLQPDAAGSYRVEVSWEPDEPGTLSSGGLVRSTICVRFGEAAREVYRLETAAWKEAGA